jgi:Rho-type GTPase-activating protein 1/2
VEGIYRKAGGASQVQVIKDGFETSPQQNFDISDPDLDIHAVSSALKQYFRRLPNPLITYEVYDKLLETTSVSDPDAKVEAMSRALLDLPRVHREVLEFLVFHLKRVVSHERDNLMTSMNVAVVFAPTIMRPESLAREMTDTQVKNEAIQFLVENCQAVFNAIQR